MTNRNGKLAGVIIAVVILAVIVGSAFAGYKIVTTNEVVDGKFKSAANVAKDKTQKALGIDLDKLFDKDSDEKNGESGENGGTDGNGDEIKTGQEDDVVSVDPAYSYKIQGTSNYNGPVILQTNKYIYNSEGKILEECYENTDYVINLSMNADRSGAVYMYDQKCYYIDADLNMTMIAENVFKSGISYDGSHAFYIQSKNDESEYNVLYVYDIKSGKAEKITDHVIEAVISPNGKKVLYHNADNGYHLMVGDAKGYALCIADDTLPDPVAISNDGKTAFYVGLSDNEGFFCYHKGKKIKMSRHYVNNAYFDRDVSRVIFEDEKRIKYCDATVQKVTEVSDLSLSLGYVSGVSAYSTDHANSYWILDTDSFADVLTFRDSRNAVGLKSDKPKGVILAENSTSAPYVAVTGEGPSAVYGDTYRLMKATYNGAELKEKILYEDSRSIYTYAASEDLSEIWLKSEKVSAIIYIKDGEEPKLVSEMGTGDISYMEYNPEDGMCYYIYNDNLMRVGDDRSTESVVYRGAKRVDEMLFKNTYLYFYDLAGNRFALIAGEILPYEGMN